MKIIKGTTKPKGLRVVIYGVAGVGKTTLAAKLPDSLFLDYEDGTHGISVDKIEAADLPKTYDEMKGLIAAFKRDHQGYERIVIDTADKFEQTLAKTLAAKKGIEDIFAANDYGRTIAVHKSGMESVLDALTELAKSGMDVVILAHETSRKVEPLETRDTTGTYDHHELKLSKTVSPTFIEWADVVIFCAYKTFLVSGEKKSDKAHVEGGKRWCFTTYSNDWEAKRRPGINLPDDCSLDKMAEILPKAIAAAVDRKTSSPSSERAQNEAKTTLAKKRDASSAPKAEESRSSDAPAEKPEREAVASLRRLAANYDVTPDQLMVYLAANPKVKERFGTLDGVAFADLPEAILSWLSKGMEKVAEKIKNK
ncbi:MAG: ATP-binding protein [Kiritimatiellia bacterium]